LLQRYAASTVAPLSLLVPVIGLLSAMLLLGEFPTACSGWDAGVLLGMVVNQFGGKWAALSAPGGTGRPAGVRAERPHHQC
jgi:O-acetylserine/cysteine efflux transporter